MLVISDFGFHPLAQFLSYADKLVNNRFQIEKVLESNIH